MIERERDFFLKGKEEVRTCISPRVFVLTSKGDFPIVRYGTTNWFGLPGGNPIEDEDVESGEFLSSGAFPTLLKEVEEECGIALPDSLNVFCLGIARIGRVDNIKKEITLTYTPIFICDVPEIGDVKEGVSVVNIWSHLQGPLFPDARMGISYYQEAFDANKGSLISPQLFNNKSIFYVQMEPQIQLLMGRPDWTY